MVYDLFWSFVIFAILLGAVIYYGISIEPAEERKAKSDDTSENQTADAAGADAETGEESEKGRKS